MFMQCSKMSSNFCAWCYLLYNYPLHLFFARTMCSCDKMFLNPFMLLEAEAKLFIQDRLKVTVSWNIDIDKISAGSERILSEFVQNKNGWEGWCSLMIYYIEHVWLLADNYPTVQERIIFEGDCLHRFSWTYLDLFRIRKMMVLSIILKILLLPHSYNEAP